jgi:hypothetical protein
MKEILQEISNTLNDINQRDIWDYASILAPLVLSFVATIISICTAIKQNRIGKRQNEIALFEHRIKVLNILNFLLPVAKIIVNDSKKVDEEKIDIGDILATAMQTYKYSTVPFDKHIEFSQVEYFYKNLILDSTSLPYLFKNENTTPILSFLNALNSIASKVCNGDKCDEELALLEKNVCKIEETNIIAKLGKYLEL